MIPFYLALSNPYLSLLTYLSLSLSAGWSKEYLISGSSDGSVSVRPAKHPGVFVRFMAHNGMCGGVSAASLSFDDNYVVSAGLDGVLVVHRVR
jgi:WD40 repeat protein